jgi:hypothetical protein
MFRWFAPLCFVVLATVLWIPCFAQQPIPPDSLKPTLTINDTIDKTIVYTPTATFTNFKELKDEVTRIGIGSTFECESYYGIFFMCEMPPYAVGQRNFNGRSCNIQYKISGNDSIKANLILISAELHNPDYKMQTLEELVDVARKTLNMLGEPMPENLRFSILSMADYNVRTNRGYTLRLKTYKATSIEAIEMRIDATGM